MSIVVKEFNVNATHSYRVKLRFDDATLDGEKLAIEAIRVIGLKHPAIIDWGNDGFVVVGQNTFFSSQGNLHITADEILQATDRDLHEFEKAEADEA